MHGTALGEAEFNVMAQNEMSLVWTPRSNVFLYGGAEFICVAAPSQTATDRFGQKLSDITSTLEAALTAYDAQNLSQWDFAPLAPLVKCE